MLTISQTRADYVARELGYRMTGGWGEAVVPLKACVAEPKCLRCAGSVSRASLALLKGWLA